MKRKIAFTRVYQDVPIAESVRRMIVAAFPEYEVETFTVTQLLRQHPGLMLSNTLAALVENGFSIFKNKKVFRKAFMGTPFLFKRARQMVRELILPDLEAYVFSIQLQSLFDLSIPGLHNFVYTDHTHLENLAYADFDPQGLRSETWLALENEIYQNAVHIFTRSDNISASLVGKYGIDPGKITCVYAGANVKTGLEGKGDRDYHRKNVLFVGIDWERKGGPDLAAAFERVLHVHPDASLTIIGCNPSISLPNTKVYGYLPPEDLQKHYRRASLFCLPTHLEPFGVVFIEAMAYGLPLLATEVGAIPDFVAPGVNGYLVSPGDVDSLAARLTAMLGDPDLLRMFGDESLQLARERYNWESVGQKIRDRILDETGVSSSV